MSPFSSRSRNCTFLVWWLMNKYVHPALEINDIRDTRLGRQHLHLVQYLLSESARSGCSRNTNNSAHVARAFLLDTEGFSKPEVASEPMFNRWQQHCCP